MVVRYGDGGEGMVVVRVVIEAKELQEKKSEGLQFS